MRVSSPSAGRCNTTSWAIPTAGRIRRQRCRRAPRPPPRWPVEAARGLAMTARLLAASWVLPVTAPPIRDGAVAVEDGRITWVGPRREAPALPLQDLGAGVLMPGLVNAHCHLELSHLRGLAPERPGFVPWVDELVRRRAAVAADEARRAAA